MDEFTCIFTFILHELEYSKPTENNGLKWKERRIKGRAQQIYMVTVLWDVTPFNLVDRLRTFRMNLLTASSMWKLEASGSSETLARSYQIIRRHVPEDCNRRTILIPLDVVTDVTRHTESASSAQEET
jgi:hypothetical protein